MRSYNQVVLTNSIVNLTAKTICMYEELTGKIIEFPPSSAILLPTQSCKRSAGNRKKDLSLPLYVVSQKVYKSIKKSCRGLDDIAVVSDEASGRDNIQIVRLRWGKDPRFDVRFCDDCLNAMF